MSASPGEVLARKSVLTMVACVCASQASRVPELPESVVADGYTATDFLGSGKSSVIWKLHSTGKRNMCLSVPRCDGAEAERELMAEVDIVKRLGTHPVPGVPEVVAHTNKCIVYKEVLEPVCGFFRKDWEDLFDTLHKVHEQGLVHRDIRPANLMRNGSGRIMVIDWTFAVDVEKGPRSKGYCGTVTFASDRVRDIMTTWCSGFDRDESVDCSMVPLPSDDIESAMLCAMHFSTAAANRPFVLARTQCGDEEEKGDDPGVEVIKHKLELARHAHSYFPDVWSDAFTHLRDRGDNTIRELVAKLLVKGPKEKTEQRATDDSSPGAAAVAAADNKP